MRVIRERPTLVLIAVLVVLPLVLLAYKVTRLGFSLEDVLPRTQYRLTLDMTLDGHDGDVRVRTFLPFSDAHQSIGDETDDALGFHLASETVGENRVATWSGGAVQDGARVQHSFTALTTALAYDIDPALELPPSYPSAIAIHLRPEEAIQVDAPEIEATLRRIGAHEGSVLDRLRRIFDFTAGLPQRPFTGFTDALTALRLGEASCNGRSRLFVALARASGLPARLVGGVILEEGRKRTSHQWVEVWIAGHWVPFCATNSHFAELPASYLVLYRGDESLFRHTSDINFDYHIVTAVELVPAPRVREWLPAINVWALFLRLGLSFSLLRTILMLPFGALVVVLFRNVVGMPTFGTFLPALIAAAAGETGAFWGVVGVLLVVAVVGLVRGAFHRLQLLHSPMLAVLLAAVTTTILATSLFADAVGLDRLRYITLFPIAVLAITAERFYLSTTERGLRTSLKELGGTLLVTLACHAVMSSLALQVLVIGFPETLLLVIAADVYLGRWVGMRVLEHLRFQPAIDQEGSSA
jgi:hypothetical protein